MQRIIRDHFQHHTIIAVAHKLRTILDFDRVMVLDKGTVAECDNPRVLLANEGTVFGELYRAQHGDSESDSE